MLQLNGVQVDIPKMDLYKDYAVFTIEFESDCKLLVCHTCETPVKAALNSVIDKIRCASSAYLPSTMEALANSKYITVQVYQPKELAQCSVLNLKYELIEKYNTFTPGGHNIPYTPGQKPLEKQIVKDLMLKTAATMFSNLVGSKRGRTPRPVYQYERKNSVWQLKKKFERLSDVTGDVPEANLSNICLCCKEPTRTAYGFKWSYSGNAEIELNS